LNPRRLPDLGHRGEGWFLIQIVLFVAIWGAGLIGPQWHGVARTAGSLVGAVAFAAGGVLALRGFVDLRENLTVFPKPRSGATLVDTGSYRLVRHPIYGGLILMAAGWGLIRASIPALAAAFVLGVFFDMKSRREELWLEDKFEDYPAYRARTRRLFPWVY
jgi:protein-S-isoprenylcysteine O-methyltransferase Ste14